MKYFSILEEKFRVSARPRNILCKLKTKLEVISRYQEVGPVSFREIAETSRKVTNLHAQSCPETSVSFHNYFS